MNICIIAPYFFSKKAKAWGGIGKYKLVKELVKTGGKYVIVAPKKKTQPEFEIDEGIFVYRFRSVIIPGVRYPVPDFIQMARLIRKVAREHDIDLYDVHNQEYLTSLPVFFIRKKPVVVTVDNLPGVAWSYGNRLIDMICYLQSHMMGKYVIRQADRVRLLSFIPLNDILRWGVPESKLKIIYQGIDVQKYRPGLDASEFEKEFNLESGEVRLVYVGRFNMVKGVIYLVEAVKILLKKHLNLKLILVGPFPEVIRDQIENYKELYSRNILFTGKRMDVDYILNASDIFVLPSLSETVSASVKEAAATELPIIASDVGAVSKVVVHNRTGLLVNPGDVASLVQAISKLVENSELRIQMGKEARRLVSKDFSWPEQAKKVLSLYKEAMGERKQDQEYHA